MSAAGHVKGQHLGWSANDWSPSPVDICQFVGHEITPYSFCLREATAVSLSLHFQSLKLPTFVDVPGKWYTI